MRSITQNRFLNY